MSLSFLEKDYFYPGMGCFLLGKRDVKNDVRLKL